MRLEEKGFKHRNLKKGLILAIAIVLYSVAALASDQEPGNCIDFKETPDLYNDCLERVHRLSIGSIPENMPQKESEEICHCDVRKRHQVEQRLRKRKELRELTDGKKSR